MVFRGLADRRVQDVSRSGLALVAVAVGPGLMQSVDLVRHLSKEVGVGRLRADAQAYLTEILTWSRRTAENN